MSAVRCSLPVMPFALLHRLICPKFLVKPQLLTRR
jgi:hypothetical protein